MAKKRLNFKCWNSKCKRTYSLLRELSLKEKLFVACPFCGEEAVVDLAPYIKPIIETYKDITQIGNSEAVALELPEILPTEKPPSEELEA